MFPYGLLANLKGNGIKSRLWVAGTCQCEDTWMSGLTIEYFFHLSQFRISATFPILSETK